MNPEDDKVHQHVFGDIRTNIQPGSMFVRPLQPPSDRCYLGSVSCHQTLRSMCGRRLPDAGTDDVFSTRDEKRIASVRSTRPRSSPSLLLPLFLLSLCGNYSLLFSFSFLIFAGLHVSCSSHVSLIFICTDVTRATAPKHLNTDVLLASD